MITIVAGVPGSGKSYFAVDKISKLSKKDRGKVLHNIDGLKLGLSLDVYCKDKDLSPLDLFQPDFHDKDKSFHGFLFVIDECQALFPKSFKNQAVQRFFQLHRHYGIDIILLSQDYKLICPSISLLSELQLRAVSDIANPLPGSFMYKKMVGFESVGRTFVRKRKKVFDLYKTADFDQSETRKKSKPMLILAGLCLALLLFGLGRFFFFKDDLSSSSSSASSVKGPLPLKQAHNLRSSSSPSSPFSGSEVPYPVSIESRYSGRFLPVSQVTDWRGTFIPFLGIFFDLKDFPFPLVMTRSGLISIVPADVYDFALSYRDSIPESDLKLDDSSGYSAGASLPGGSAPSDRRGEGA